MREWQDRLSLGCGTATVLLNLDTIGRLLGIVATIVAIVCSVDRRLCERRATKPGPPAA